ncbi:hypothetical protein ACGF07_31890 [Kitasatospora sp. NPDC048194]|uniref:hypothetical protein n=1 Tax=Kitasatospora sp. NPDC048194 TaxID=3364045 RepID=UPI00371D7089
MTTPTPAEAYEHAPDQITETQALLNIAADLTGTGSRLERHRPWLLRQAALSDRSALQAGPRDAVSSETADFLAEQALQNAEKTATALLEHDRARGGHLGPLGPEAPAWTADPRGYVHQEYRAWRERQLRQAQADTDGLQREMLEVGILTQEYLDAARRGAPAPLDRRLDLARRRVAIQRLRVDFGALGSVADQHAEEAALRELEATR